MDDHKKLTNEVGAPVPDNENSITAGPRGPVVMNDVWLFEKMAHFNQEVIPKRCMLAKGSGAYGKLTANAISAVSPANSILKKAIGIWLATIHPPSFLPARLGFAPRTFRWTDGGTLRLDSFPKFQNASGRILSQCSVKFLSRLYFRFYLYALLY
jgi:hypothetical protein